MEVMMTAKARSPSFAKIWIFSAKFALLLPQAKVYHERINNLEGENRFWDGQIPGRGR
jgi:hypothetical protein